MIWIIWGGGGFETISALRGVLNPGGIDRCRRAMQFAILNIYLLWSFQILFFCFSSDPCFQVYKSVGPTIELLQIPVPYMLEAYVHKKQNLVNQTQPKWTFLFYWQMFCVTKFKMSIIYDTFIYFIKQYDLTLLYHL